MKTHSHKSALSRHDVILNPKISRPARLLWAVLRHREQEGIRDISINELAVILGVGTRTVFSYLTELRENHCLNWIEFIGVYFTTTCSTPQPKPATGNSGATESSNPHLN